MKVWSGGSVQTPSTSTDASTRAVFASLRRTTNQSIPNNTATTILYDTVDKDNAGGYSTVNGRYTASVQGRFNFSGVTRFTAGAVGEYDMLYRVNGGATISLAAIAATSAAATQVPFAFGVDLNVGDYVEVMTNQNSGGAANIVPGDIRLYVSLAPGPSQIAASETVAVRYRNSTSSFTSAGASANIVYTTKIKDDHGAYNTSTGVFTAPMSGSYSIKACAISNAIAATTVDRSVTVQVMKNGSTNYGYSTGYANSTTSRGYSGCVSDTVDLLANETMTVSLSQNFGSTMTLAGTDPGAYIAIERVAN